MNDTVAEDPLVGFNFDDYDAGTKQLTIKIHELILRHPSQRDALYQKITEILSYDDKIDSVIVKARD